MERVKSGKRGRVWKGERQREGRDGSGLVGKEIGKERDR